MSWVMAFHVFTLFLVASAMGLSLAHALELPGKLRLSKNAYFAVQGIYYPGFTFGGLIGELGGMLALALLAYLTPAWTPRFWWIAAALALLVSVHLVYWLVTHPVNNFWLKDVKLGQAGARFFTAFSNNRADEWTRLRDVWEYSHVARAILAAASFLALAIALGLSGSARS